MDVANSSLLSGVNDNGSALSVDNGRALYEVQDQRAADGVSPEKRAYGEEKVDHVLLHSASIRDDVNDLTDAGTLTRENGLVDAEVGRRDGE